MGNKTTVVGPEHPAWKAIDDDDWNGSTFSQWLLAIKREKAEVILMPGPNHSPELVQRMKKAFVEVSPSVRVE